MYKEEEEDYEFLINKRTHINYIFCNLLYELSIKEDKESFVSKLKVLLKKRNSG